jgi:formylglycine-generating enzyme required for sulfatase activity
MRLVFCVPLLLIPLILFSAEPPRPALVAIPFDAEKAKSLQTEWAKSFGVEAEITNSIGIKMALIPGGRFEMGPNGSKHRITLGKPFYIGVTEITMGQYRKFKPDHAVKEADAEFNKDDIPAAMMSWTDAQAFCKWLSEQPAEKEAGRVYALPTEAQWEWAARAGTATTRYFGDTDKGQADYSWFNVTYTPNPKHETKGRGRQPVARLKPNAWGLYDMLGNVWEWCDDRRGDTVTGESRDPVMRGGSWRSGAFHCTAVAHDPGGENMKAANIGFRVGCRVGK